MEILEAQAAVAGAMQQRVMAAQEIHHQQAPRKGVMAVTLKAMEPPETVVVVVGQVPWVEMPLAILGRAALVEMEALAPRQQFLGHQ